MIKLLQRYLISARPTKAKRRYALKGRDNIGMNQEIKTCQNCKQNFIIDPEDFAFYDKIKVPPPTWCPECRLQRRLNYRNERALYRRNCDLCASSMVSMCAPKLGFISYCQTCWYSDNWDAIQYGQNYDFLKPFFQQFFELQKIVP